MGHREEKQSARRRAIQENAVALFREVGGEALRVREISTRAGISDATFFNYFASRDTVFREWAEDLIDAAFARAGAQGDSGEGLRRAVRSLSSGLAAHVAEEGDALVAGIRMIGAGSWSFAEPPARGREIGPDGALALIEASRSRGEIRSDVPAAQLAWMLRSVVVSALVRGVEIGSSPGASRLSDHIRSSADVVLDGMRKRNERVQVNSNITVPLVR